MPAHSMWEAWEYISQLTEMLRASSLLSELANRKKVTALQTYHVNNNACPVCEGIHFCALRG